MKIGNVINLILKMAYGAEILRFRIQVYDFSTFWGSIFEAKMELKWVPNGVTFRYGLANTDFYELIVSRPDFHYNWLHRGWILEAKIN